MKRKSVTMIAGAAAVALLAGAYLALRSYNRETKEAEETAALGETILEIDTQKLASVAFSAEGKPYTFTKAGDAWRLDGDETFPVDSEALIQDVSALTPLRALRTLTDAEDPAEYGLDAPQQEITLENEDGEKTVIAIGDTNDNTGDDYLMLNGDSATVYTVASSVRTALSDDLYDYAVSEDLPALTKDNITSIEVDGTEHPYSLYREDDAWKLKAEGDAQDADTDTADDAAQDADTDAADDAAQDTDTDAADSDAQKADTDTDADAVQNLLSQLTNLSYVDYLEHNCQDFSAYGLDAPAAEITVSYKEDSGEKTLLLAVGTTDSLGNYYTRLGDSAQVHTVSSSLIDSLLDSTAEELAEKESETET